MIKNEKTRKLYEDVQKGKGYSDYHLNTKVSQETDNIIRVCSEKFDLEYEETAELLIHMGAVNSEYF